jgi:hypothetical protein
MNMIAEKHWIHFCCILGFIEFIVEPSMAVCSDMLESILGPIHSTCKPSDGAQQSISEDSEIDRAKNGKFVVLCSYIGENEMMVFQNIMYLEAPVSWDGFLFL